MLLKIHKKKGLYHIIKNIRKFYFCKRSRICEMKLQSEKKTVQDRSSASQSLVPVNKMLKNNKGGRKERKIKEAIRLSLEKDEGTPAHPAISASHSHQNRLPVRRYKKNKNKVRRAIEIDTAMSSHTNRNCKKKERVRHVTEVDTPMTAHSSSYVSGNNLIIEIDTAIPSTRHNNPDTAMAGPSTSTPTTSRSTAARPSNAVTEVIVSLTSERTASTNCILTSTDNFYSPISDTSFPNFDTTTFSEQTPLIVDVTNIEANKLKRKRDQGKCHVTEVDTPMTAHSSSYVSGNNLIIEIDTAIPSTRHNNPDTAMAGPSTSTPTTSRSTAARPSNAVTEVIVSLTSERTASTNCILTSRDNFYSPISDTSFPNFDTTTFSEQTPLIVDVTNTEANKLKRKRDQGKCPLVDDTNTKAKRLNRKSEWAPLMDATNTKAKKSKSKGKCYSVIRSIFDNEINESDDDVINIPSDDDDDDDDEVIVLDDNDVIPPPCKKRKTTANVPVIDLSTPESHRKLPQPVKLKGEVKNNNTEVLKPYVSILGTPEQRGPLFPSRIGVNPSRVSSPRVPPAPKQRGRRALPSSRNVDPSGGPPPSGHRNNVYNAHPVARTGLRPIVIDRRNVAMGHSNGAFFSCSGLKTCINYFLERGHEVIAFVPQYRKGHPNTRDSHLLHDGMVCFTPSKRINGQLVVPYDDRYIVQYAAIKGGVIVSSDSYRDLLPENLMWKETIQERVLAFTWAGDMLMFPLDPLGRRGPTLERFLQFPNP